jgi:hypothetical protein
LILPLIIGSEKTELAIIDKDNKNFVALEELSPEINVGDNKQETNTAKKYSLELN